ncbi:hypothetical protein C8R43DRAFT_997459 [Mycena crocata]|nr:hypothetical protein C8R43DRAFT_997459 [Mycena crocata]
MHGDGPEEIPAIKRILKFLHTSFAPLMHGEQAKDSAGHLDTRPPILYDYHMPPKFQLEKMEYRHLMSDELQNHLVQNLAARTSLTDGSIFPSKIEAYIKMVSWILTGIVPDEACSEDDVKTLQGRIHLISCSVATLSCFDIEDIEGFHPVFGLPGNSQANTKADALVGCRPRPADTAEKWGSLWNSVTNPDRDLRLRYFRVLYPEEYKNILAGNPRVILGIYLILWSIRKGYLEHFWPENICDSGCQKFRKSHRAAEYVEGSEDKPEDPPLDAPSFVDAKPTVFSMLKKNIKDVAHLASVYDKKHNIPDEHRTVKNRRPETAKSGQKSRRQPPQHDDEETVQELKSYGQLLEDAMTKALRDFELPEPIKQGLFRWVLNAAFILIQVWSQMVRHNATFSHLTCHNIGVVLTRHRDARTLEISEFLEYKDAPLLHATALTVYAYNDAIKRYDAHKAADKPLWEEDPYRGETQEEQAVEEKASRRKDKDDSDDSEDDEPGPRGKKSGGGGRGGGSGGGGGPGAGEGKGKGPDQDKTGDRRPRQRDPPDESDRNPKRQKKRDDLNIDNVHLAFRAPGQHLWSKGFSHFTRVGNDPEKVAHRPFHRQNLPSVAFPGTPVAVSDQTSSDQRRVSSGSIQSSRSTDSTQSAQSLFSESPSMPTSPATTGSFTDASSRDNSPFPEKIISERQTGPNDTTPATVSNAGIIIHKMVKESAGGIVWSGEMIPEDDTDDTVTIPVVVKIAVPQENVDEGTIGTEKETVRHEGQVYDFLFSSLGEASAIICPSYHGVFEDGVGSIALVLGDGGIALKTFDNCERQKREQLFAKAVEMHQAGVRHNDLEPRNIVQDADGELRIIDFHIAEIDHEGCSGMCDELVNFRQALKLGPL